MSEGFGGGQGAAQAVGAAYPESQASYGGIVRSLRRVQEDAGAASELSGGYPFGIYQWLRDHPGTPVPDI